MLLFPADSDAFLRCRSRRSDSHRRVEVVSQTAAWYHTGLPQVPVCRRLWTHMTSPTLPGECEMQKVPRVLVVHLAELLCYAARFGSR